MNATTPEVIKQQVRERYAAIALQGSSCCGPTTEAGNCCTPAGDEVALVSYDEFSSQLVEGSDLGLGCGTPTAVAGLLPGETVLDLGSGGGIDVFLAAQAVGPQGRAIGVDMTPAMLDRARANAARAGFTNVEFRLGEIEALPVADASVDVILSNCVINLAPDKSRVFGEMHRVLRLKGRFAVSDIVTYGDVPEDIRQDMALWAGCIAGAMDREAYLALLREAGFHNVRVVKETTYEAPSSSGFGTASVTVMGEKN